MRRAISPEPIRSRRFSGLFAGLVVAWSLLTGFSEPVRAQNPGVLPPSPIVIPVFIDPERRMERRPTARISTIRFLTEDDYPPFNFAGADGQLQGFNIDLARAICAELGANCTIQPRRWDLLLPALDSDGGDAVIASHRIDADLRRRFEVSAPAYRVPARFAGRRDGPIKAVDANTLQGKTIAVVGGSRHEAFLNAVFPAVKIERHTTVERALEAMRRGMADLAFGDGVAVSFWLNGSESLDCCGFIGGPFTESRFFGEGAGIVMRRGNNDLRQAIDFALWRISRDGRFAKLYLKHFPIPFY
jgi:polar amino acid transport system substrate-binding protein